MKGNVNSIEMVNETNHWLYFCVECGEDKLNHSLLARRHTLNNVIGNGEIQL